MGNFGCTHIRTSSSCSSEKKKDFIIIIIIIIIYLFIYFFFWGGGRISCPEVKLAGLLRKKLGSILQIEEYDQSDIVLNDSFTNAYFWILTKMKNMTNVLHDPYSNTPK